jgi:calmodulin
VLKKAFDAFDHEKRGCISTEMVGTILEMLGIQVTAKMFDEIIAEVDADGWYLWELEMDGKTYI